MLERKPRGYTAEQEADEDLKSDFCPSGSTMEGGGGSHPDTGQQGNRLPGERPGPRKERDWESTRVGAGGRGEESDDDSATSTGGNPSST